MSNEYWKSKCHNVYDEFQGSIEKGLKDDRAYRLIRLENGIEALLIQDPTTDVAAAAMNVGVGYLSDPDDMPGLAHLCEHVVFMGSKDDPEDAFLKYIKDQGGLANAYTIASNTCYYFAVEKMYLQEATRRFSDFFRKPFFLDLDSTDPDYQKRSSDPDFKESKDSMMGWITSAVTMVNSEYEKNKESDLLRLFQLFKSEALPGNSWSKFATGNTTTLTPKGVTDPDQERCNRLCAWWRKYYSASIMGLVILGRESLDELTRMAVGYFSDVRTADVPLPREVIPWGDKQKGNITFAQTIMKGATIVLSFCLGSQDELYESKPVNYISRMVAYEGSGSLYSSLKKSKWITRLSCLPHHAARGFSFLRIQAKLTATGLDHYKDVLKAIYAYLDLLARNLVLWGEAGRLQLRLFQQFRDIQNNRFNYSQEEVAKCRVNRLSEILLRKWPRERLLKGATGVWKLDQDVLYSILNIDLAPSAGSVMLSSDNISSVYKEKLIKDWPEEEYYKTKYITVKLVDLDSDIFKIDEKLYQDLSLPNSNESIPADFRFKGIIANPPKSPEKPNFDHPELWFKQDDQFSTPKGYFGVYIRSYAARMTQRPPIVSAKQIVMTKLVELLLTDVLAEKYYKDSLTGLHHSLVYDDDGNLVLQTGGYNDGMPGLLVQLLKTIKSKGIIDKPDSFVAYKAKLKQTFENVELSEPSIIVHAWMDYCLRSIACTAAEMVAQLSDEVVVSLQDVEVHLNQLLSKPEVTLLVTGNFTKDEAIHAQRTVDGRLGWSADPDYNRNCTNLLPPDGKNRVYLHQIKNEQESNNAVEYYLQVAYGYSDDEKTNIDETRAILQAKLLLLAHIINESAFDTLRTQDQLGYSVSSAPWVQVSVVGMLFKVQGSKTALQIEEAIDEFLVAYGKKLDALEDSDVDFIAKRTALEKTLRERPENQDQETVRFASSIFSGTNDFTLRAKNARRIHKLTPGEVRKFYGRYILPNDKRAKLSIHTIPSNTTVAAAEESYGDKYFVINKEKTLAEFRAGLGKSDPAKPVAS